MGLHIIKKADVKKIVKKVKNGTYYKNSWNTQ